jgi:hypothetical protein
VKGLSMLPKAARWPVGSALLLFAVASQALAAGTISGTLKANTKSKATVENARITATDDKYHVVRAVADASGAYTLSLDPGKYTFVVVGKGLEPQTVQDVEVKEGDKITKDFTLEEAKPLCIVKAAAPIPLTDDINSASFADAPDIMINSGANFSEPSDLSTVADYKGPTTLGGRVRLKYSSEGIHLAGDLTFANPNLNFGTDGNVWQGNAIELDFQNDPYDPTRATYDANHNWQFIVALSKDPKWWNFGSIQAVPTLNGKDVNIKDYVSIKDGPNANEQLVRVNYPWGFFLTEDKTTPITPPKDSDLGAIDIAIDSSTPDAAQDASARQFQLSWSGFNTGWQEPAVLRPVQFCPQATP